jgi:hypothetical protein
MAQINTFPERFRLGRPSATPFKAENHRGETGAWCPQCRDETDVEEQVHHQGVTYSFKRWCRRCGAVTAHGVYHNVPILSDVPLPPGTMAWVTTPGPDRR